MLADPARGRLSAYVVPACGDAGEALREDLRQELRRTLSEPMVPSAWVLLEALPTSPNGKIDRRALASLAPAETEGGHAAAPSGPTEELVAAIWSDVLGIERIGPDGNFFTLGGHSLLAARVGLADGAHFREGSPGERPFPGAHGRRLRRPAR